MRYFLAVVDHGNFSRAATACNVSQPTLSVGIGKLEREIGRPLFVRSNQRVELTEAGMHFLAPARRIEREFNTMLQAMKLPAELPSLRLGVLSSIPGEQVSASIAEAQPTARHRFELLFGNERELVGYLVKGRIDIALTVVGRGADRFPERAVLTEGYSLAVASGHPAAGEADLSPEQIANDTMIVRRHCEALSETSRFFTERGVRPHFALRSMNDERVLQMVAADLGITVMPDCYRFDGVARPRLAGFRLQRVIGWKTTHQSEHLLSKPVPLMTAVEAQLLH